jgi:hypothetical protein
VADFIAAEVARQRAVTGGTPKAKHDLGRGTLNISNQLDCQTILSLSLRSSIEDSATKSCVSLPLLLREG